MGKKLSDIQKEVEANAILFRKYLDKVLDKEINSFLDNLSKHYEVYIFSGVIRNYFIKATSNRDIDIVIDGYGDIEQLISTYEYKINSYGGYKIEINGMHVDLWFLQDTWALHHQKKIDFDLTNFIPNYIPETAFFNFSSIIFHLNNNKFTCTKYFARFLRDKKIDIVFAPNANNALCVINTLYYADKYKFKIADKLMRHIKQIYKANIDKFEETQLKHFGKILYPKEEIIERVQKL